MLEILEQYGYGIIIFIFLGISLMILKKQWESD